MRPWVQDVITDAFASLGSVTVRTTERRGHAQEIAAQAQAAGHTLVVTFGGDGTINETVNGLLSNGPGAGVPTLATLPGGHTNVVPRLLGYAPDPIEATSQAISAAREHHTRIINLATADDRWFVFSAGLGLDAEVLRRVEAQRAQGAKASIPRYAASAILAHATTTSPLGKPQLRLEIPDAAPIDGIFTAVIQNSSVWTYVGALPITFAPDASFENGLWVYGIPSLDPISLGNRLVLATLSPGRLDPTGANLSEFTLSAETPTPFQLDGDVVGERTRITFTSVPAALRILVPVAFDKE